MIEEVEGFGAELQRLRFRQLGVLQERHIPIVQARTMEETPARIPNRSGRLGSERVNIEIGDWVAHSVQFAGIGIV